jgi:CPA2 family monovalent cation:H+ antiporter-2
VVIVGYGVAGQVLAHALRENGTAYTILEINLERVVHARAEGEPAFYGDVANPDAVQLARVREARALVLLIDDPPAAERAIAAARQHAPGTPILVRARHLRSTPGLLALGADEVVADEVEAGLEVLARVLRRVGTARNLLNQRVRRARERTQTTARELTVPRPRLGEVPELGDLKVESFLVTPTAHAAGRTTLELELRARTGALVVAVRRGETLLEQTDPSDAFRPGDMLYLVGSRDALARAILELEGCPPPSQDTDGVFET